jgi:ankyrin repeat protein
VISQAGAGCRYAGTAMVMLSADEPLAVAVVQAIRTGDLPALTRLLEENPALAGARIREDKPCGRSRSLLHVATDWPGHYPNGPATVAALVAAGADVNARFTGPHSETPLHWAASSDDVDVLDALIDAGADVEAPGAVIAGGTPIADATAFGQWNAARRLIERGARTNLWESAALGLLDRLDDHFAAGTSPAAAEIDGAFWGACHGGQLPAAEYLLARGADVNWIPDWEPLTPLDAARRSGADHLVAWLLQRGAESAAGAG